MLLSVHYYDAEGRVLQTKSQNHLDGQDIIDNTYNFAGELTASTRSHTEVVPGQQLTLLTGISMTTWAQDCHTGKYQRTGRGGTEQTGLY
ncbi:hypothetical protein CS542_04085 [Pedobacter sp. IW39]|nr:hypothetical protein CS542_04085 [Pedobacter sp. IW39]